MSKEQHQLFPLRFFPLKDYSKDALEAFIRQRTVPEWDTTSVLRNHYVILNDYDENINEFIRKLCFIAQKTKPGTFSGIIREENLLSKPQRFQKKEFNRNYLLFVTDCRDSEMNETERAQWEEFRKILSTPEAPTVFLVTTKDIFEKRFGDNDALYHRFFTRETKIVFNEDFTSEEIHSLLNEEIDQRLPFRRTPAFDARMEEYLTDVYVKADLKRQAFLEDMIRRINALYYQKNLENMLLTEDCVPYWKQGIDEDAPDTEEVEVVLPDTSEEEVPEVQEVPQNTAEEDTSEVQEVPQNAAEENTPEKEYVRISKFTGNNSVSEKPENILILALSVFNRKGYTETAASDPEGNEYSYYYQMEPVAQMLIRRLAKSGKKLDKILLLASANTVTPANKQVKIDNKYLQLETVSDSDLCQASAVDYFVHRLNECTEGYVPEYQVFTYKDESSPDNTLPNFPALHTGASIIETLHQILSEIRKTPRANLYMDIHGGLRLHQQIMSSVISLLDIEGIPVQPANVYSVEYNDVSKIVEASESVQINKFVSGMNELTKYGRIGSLKEYLEKNIKDSKNHTLNNLLTTLESIANDIQFCNVAQFEKDLKNISGCLSAVEQQGFTDSLLPLFLEDVRNTFGKLSESSISVPDEIIWCLEKGFYQQALSITEAKMPAYFATTGILECSEEAKETIAIIENYPEGLPRKTFEKRIFPDVLKSMSYSIKALYDPYTPKKKPSISLQDILKDSSLNVMQKIVKKYNICEWKINSLRFHFDTESAVELIILHATLKNLRNNMNHPNKELPFKLNSHIVEARIREYVELAERLSKTEEPLIHIDYIGSIPPAANTRNIKQKEEPKATEKFKAKETALNIPDPKPIESINPEAVKKYAQMLCTYAQEVGTHALFINEVNTLLHGFFKNLPIPNKKDIYLSGKGKVLDAVCASYPSFFSQTDTVLTIHEDALMNL